jgi:WG containing repeat
MHRKIPHSLLIAFLIFWLTPWTYGQSGQAATRLRPVQLNGKWGYIDSTGKIVIEPRFAWAEEFSEGLAAFENEDGKHGYIDETGKVVIEPVFDNWTEFSEGLAAVSVNFEWGYIDKTGKWVVRPQFSVGRPFSDGMALVGVPLNGKVTFPPGPVKHVFIDKAGRVVIDPKAYILNGSFSGGFAAVQFVTQKGVNEVIIDKTGKVIIAAEKVGLEGFGEGLAPVQKNGKWGYVDSFGQFAIQPQFDDANSFSEGLAAVQIGDKWGYIDREGKFVIKPKYSFGYDSRTHAFSEGLALVYLKDGCGYIDKTGKMVIKIQCNEADKFIGGLASIHVGESPGEKRGYINRHGKYVWGPTPFKYKSLEEIQARVEKDKKDEEVLTPLTDEERSLNPREIIASQPDFVADLTFFRSETVSGGGGSMHIARKGNRYRQESQFWIFIGEEGKPAARLYPEAKAYDDLEPARDESAGGSWPFNPKTLAQEPDITFVALGAVEVAGHRCIKIEAIRKDKPEKIYLYVARDLKNLIIVAQILNPPRSFVQTLSNISLEVPDSLVSVPPDYKPIEHDRWTKVETAKLTYGGKPSKDYGVFRAPGGELFVWVNDARYPWHYLVRPREGTVETAFQGLLVTRSGRYIWQTNDTEAFSGTYYRNRRPEQGKGEPVAVKPNSVKFRSNDYDKDKAMIEVKW